MKLKGDHVEINHFSMAFGIVMISVGLTWFLRTIGVWPESIKLLPYVFPICVILFGVRILTSHDAKKEIL